jgi:glutamate-1-semialdehyde 2,1-aminomutase
VDDGGFTASALLLQSFPAVWSEGRVRIPVKNIQGCNMLCHDRSRQMREDSRKTLAGGVHSSMRAAADPTLFFDRAEGPFIFDVDGNRYIDYKMGAGPLMLGHSPPDVIAAVRGALDLGLQTATETPLGAEVAARLAELVPCAGLVHFANTGSEAVHLALRLARAHTGRDRVICFEGHFHGWLDNICFSSAAQGFAAPPATSGQGNALEHLIMLPWNDANVLARVVADHAGQVGAVIMNPVMLAGSPGGTMPRPGYLQRVREICNEHDIVLIFDEVLTGFRVALGGAQELFGVLPDLATYAKAISAGLSLAAIAGTHPLMEHLATNEVAHPGTYNGNLLCMAAARAALEHLSVDDGRFYRHCNRMRERLTDGIRAAAARHEIPVNITGAGAVMTVWFTDRPDYHDYQTAKAAHHAERSARFFRGLQERGVLSNPSMFLTDAHTQREIDLTLEAVEGAMAALRD